LDSWKKIGSLRTIFTTQLCDDNGQMLLEIARPDSVIYTNSGCNTMLTKQLEVIGHTLLECYKADVVTEADIPHIHLNCYPTTFRRNLIDFAVLVVASGGSNTLQVMKGVWENLRIGVLWNLCQCKKRVPSPIL
jgi:hypothetical protein